ncbi:MAG: T9SS type A sorting domain-containing protein [Rhizobacter sp.]|nr:T9SS type A sorting domain-containing protein [Chlorobiales bacterium]
MKTTQGISNKHFNETTMMKRTANTLNGFNLLDDAKQWLLVMFLFFSLAFSSTALAQPVVDGFSMILFPGETVVSKGIFTTGCYIQDRTVTFGQPTLPYVQINPSVWQASNPPESGNGITTPYTITYTAPDSPGTYLVEVPIGGDTKYKFYLFVPDINGYYYYNNVEYIVGGGNGSSNSCYPKAGETAELPVELIRASGAYSTGSPSVCQEPILASVTTWTHTAFIHPDLKPYLEPVFDGKEPIILSVPTYTASNGVGVTPGTTLVTMTRTVQAPRIKSSLKSQYSIFERIERDLGGINSFEYKRWDVTVRDTNVVCFYHQLKDPTFPEDLQEARLLTSSERPDDPVYYSLFDTYDGSGAFYYPDPVKICADSSNATLITFRDPISKRGQTVEFEVEMRFGYNGGGSAPPSIFWDGKTYNPSFGKFETVSQSPDSMVVRYTHPSYVSVDNYSSALGIRVLYIDEDGTKSKIREHPIDLYNAPVAFFHGQWDNTSCFQQMKDSFVSDGWPKELLWLANYSPGRKGGGSNDAPFAVNIERGTVVIDIDNALRAARKAGYSAGKVSLVGHSYGGVLSRLYVQETPPATGGSFIKYRNDVSRVITIGSPHLGSQQGDDLYYGLSGGDTQVLVKALIMGSIINQDVLYTATQGSLQDLRTESPVMRFLMNDPAGIERNKVPSSAVYTIASPCQLIEDALEQNGFINVSLIFGYLENTINFLNNIPFVNLGGVIEGASTNAINKLISETFPSVFNGDESELSVSVGSALGNPSGSPAATFAAENVLHGKQPRDPAVIAKTKELLLVDPYTSTKFTKGFHPVPPPQFADPSASQYLYFDPSYKGKDPSPDTCLKEIPTSPSARSVQMAYAKTMAGKGMYGLRTSDVSSTITAPADNQTFAVGQSVTMQVQPQGAVAAQIFAVRYPNVAPTDSSHIIMGFDPVGAATAFTFKVPDAAIGKAYLFACTLDSLGNYTSIDSAVINISVPASVISLQTYNSFYATEVGDTTMLNLYGTFSDDIKRDITGLAGLSYTSSNPSVIEVLGEQVLVAKAIGTATITASYQGQQMTTEAEVSPVTSAATSSVGSGNGDGATTPKSGNVSKAYSLSQNYPNPFNPATRISFSLPSAGLVKLKVYDVLGRVVKVLVDEKRDAGRYEVSFDASRFASGVYFYRLQSGNFIQSKKMILVK